MRHGIALLLLVANLGWSWHVYHEATERAEATRTAITEIDRFQVEMDVLALDAMGRSPRQIARTLGMSVGEVQIILLFADSRLTAA